MGRIDGEGRQDRKDLAQEMLLQPVALPAGQIRDVEDDDAGGRQLLAQRAPPLLLRGHQRRDPLADALELLPRGEAVLGVLDDVGQHLAHEARHAHHEELVEVVGRDRQEPEALEQRMAPVRGLLQHAPVEFEPRQLAIDEAFGRSRQRRGRRLPGQRPFDLLLNRLRRNALRHGKSPDPKVAIVN